MASLIYQVDAMQLDGPAKAKAAIDTFKPTNLLIVQHTNRFLVHGDERGETYVFTLNDIVEKRDIWKGTIGIGAAARLFTDRTNTGATLATKLVRQMADDNVLQQCPAPVKPA